VRDPQGAWWVPLSTVAAPTGSVPLRFDVTDTRPNVCIFAPTLLLTVTAEKVAGDEEFADLHFHPGGQGFWIARMLRGLGERPVVVSPAGGETGLVLRGLAPAWHVDLRMVEIEAESPAYLHDRRSGERKEIAQSRLPKLNRHEMDDLYGRVLAEAIDARCCVVTGRMPGDSLPPEFYKRLGADLAATRVMAIGDLHGAELSAYLEGGPLHTLKVSDADLVVDGALSDDAPAGERIEAVGRYHGLGAERVVISSARQATIARFGDVVLCAKPPALVPADHRGSGDSMTAGLAMAALRGLGAEQSLRIACAAGAANVTRHGLGGADARLVESLAARVEVKEMRGGG
jgi:1-phosphofructokinase